MNGLTGAKSAKSSYQDLLPYQTASQADSELMKSARNSLVNLLREGRLPQWAEGEAMKHESVRKAIHGD